ncbi:MAG TPA: beta-glucosidase [Saprospirales bacterium]|nr:beta-glucosidase [Saprospirales bacterium]HAY70482.1 beta-glucosidase [Saprospirales bacterium]HRQ30172.1 glucoamylase family protein [Saprospiraceae bacterium]
MKFPYVGLFLMLLIFNHSCDPIESIPESLEVNSLSINGIITNDLKGSTVLPEIRVRFNKPVDISIAQNVIVLSQSGAPATINIISENDDSTLIIQPKNPLRYITRYDFIIYNQLSSKSGETLSNALQASLTTEIDPNPKFSNISDEDLLTLVQEQTFRYFWEFGHPVSGLARERNNSGDLVTSGGSGFGVMSVIVGIERGFITRQQGLNRLLIMTDFLKNKADRFHGVFPHWLNGVTGKAIAFSTKDDGGDLVETSYLIAGLLAASAYFDQSDADEATLRQTIKDIWETVEWSWHTKNGQNVLYWHWSPKYNWEMNHQIRGYNEALITYVLAAASPTYPVSKEVYEQGWAQNGTIKNGKSFYGITLPLGYDFGGPLFFAHYTFLGINPLGLNDQFANYEEQVVNHSKINHAYCVSNPRNFYGYHSQCWGLTASDNNTGYSAHSPTNDKGIISPTAALSSMPYTPSESMEALKYFYYVLGDKTFREFGFIDAFSLHYGWFASSFLAIDQGPIIVMIENHRTGLIWDLCMNQPDFRYGLTKLGFSSTKYNF